MTEKKNYTQLCQKHEATIARMLACHMFGFRPQWGTLLTAPGLTG